MQRSSSKSVQQTAWILTKGVEFMCRNSHGQDGISFNSFSIPTSLSSIDEILL